MALTIRRLLEQVNAGHIRIPAFQRGFVWEMDRVAHLIDSIFRNQRAHRSRPGSGRDLVIRFDGFEPVSTPFGDFVQFLDSKSGSSGSSPNLPL